jgi:hypothetical protein
MLFISGGAIAHVVVNVRQRRVRQGFERCLRRFTEIRRVLSAFCYL